MTGERVSSERGSDPAVRIKICGLRRREDLELCISLGVDWVGFNFWSGSKRFIAPDEATKLAALLPDSVKAVGVFVNAPPDEVLSIARQVGLHAVQLHGDENVEDYADVPARLIQVVRVAGEAALEVARISSHAHEVLLDASVAGYGGSGRRFDWGLAIRAQRRFGRRVFLAGGLTPENVAEAVTTVHPAAVDVASGVESAPGEKDPAKLRAFVQAVRAAAKETR